MFTTSNLHLVPFDNTKHYETFKANINDYEAAFYLTDNPIVPRGDKFIQGLIESTIDNNLFVASIELKSSGAFIGIVNARMDNAKNRNGTFGLTIIKEHWGKGYGTEVLNLLLEYAFQNLGFHRMSLTVFQGNDRAIALYKKIGFIEEGRTREARFVNGEFQDAIQMGMLAREWREKASQ